MDFIAAYRGSQIATYGIGHVASSIIDNIFRIIGDGTILCRIGDIGRSHFRLCFCTIFANHRFCDTIPFLLGIALVTVFVLRIAINAFSILASGRSISVFVCQNILRIRRSLGEGIVIVLGVFGYICYPISSYIGSGFFPISGGPVFGMIERPFFIVGELAFCGIAVLCHFSQI